MKAKQYLAEIRSGRGAVVHIAYYRDTPAKNYRIYFNGADIGLRYEYLGNAARHLEYIISQWNKNGQYNIRKIYRYKDNIPQR